MATTRNTRRKAADEAKDEDVQGSKTEQHPALKGNPAEEVQDRTPDGETSGLHYRKAYVVLGTFGDDHPVHEQNRSAVHNEAIQRGLHPKAVARLVGTEESAPDRRGNVTSTLTYEVEVVPAVIDTEHQTTVAPSDIPDEQGEA
ncbi:hypothetical protein ACIGG9_16075 [Pseudonocardia alni]|uniref:hypothetical protein n=1 Tax=Pseudonocardia alni TaxID=33907 RepID=UPI003402D0FA